MDWELSVYQPCSSRSRSFFQSGGSGWCWKISLYCRIIIWLRWLAFNLIAFHIMIFFLLSFPFFRCHFFCKESFNFLQAERLWWLSGG